jgi:ribosomal protein L35AE/L33A
VDIAPLGANANDPGDADTGANEGLNYPVITSAVVSGTTTRVQGTLNSKPNSQVEVRLFMNPTCNASGFGESLAVADTVVGLTTDASGNVSFDRTISFPINRASFPWLTAQTRRFAENPGLLVSALEVSEFSACFPVAGSTPVPTLSIGDVSIVEGNTGTSVATFTVTLSAASATAVTVTYATADATATVGTDYLASTGVLTFAAGQTSKAVTVSIVGDATVEANETFVVNLTAPGGATLAKAQAVGTITNDDVAPPVLPTLSIADVSVTEGNAGTVTATFNVTLSAAAAGTVTMSYATADGTATSGSDYAAASGTLSFAPGDLVRTIAVTVNGDATVEPNENFAVTLSAASGATIAKASGQGTITNDDTAPPGGGGGGGGAMDPWVLAARGLFVLMLKYGRSRAPRRTP